MNETFKQTIKAIFWVVLAWSLFIIFLGIFFPELLSSVVLDA